MLRILSSVIAPQPAAPTDAEIESALRRDAAFASPVGSGYGVPPAYASAPRPSAVPHHIPPVRADVEIKDDRFYDRTIPQATSMILREAGGPLHVNEIYNRLKEGGFQFTGQHPTISIAVSLNRNRRFRKVAPGTFDLMIRDAAQAS
jgi:HB1, ASXL, restriction endonuclease HTH domain